MNLILSLILPLLFLPFLLIFPIEYHLFLYQCQAYSFSTRAINKHHQTSLIYILCLLSSANMATPSRPWFRFGRQPPPQVPAPQPPPPRPRPPVARPTFRPAAQPQPQPQPQLQPQSTQTEPVPRAAASTAPPPPVPTSPPPRAPAPSSSLPPSPAPTTSTAVPSSPKPQVSAPTASVPSSPATRAAKISSSVPTSPDLKPVDSRILKPAMETPTAPPPSPLTLPPSRIKPQAEPKSKSPPKAEPKDVLVQESMEKINADTHKHSIDRTGKQGVPKEADTKGIKAQRKKLSYYSDTEEGGFSVITLAGENKGAFMEVIKSPNKNGLFEGTSYTSSNSEEEEGKRDMKKKDKKNRAMSMNSTPKSAFMNSNVQGVNNSILYKSSCSYNDPGVHLALSRKHSNGGFRVKGRTNGEES